MSNIDHPFSKEKVKPKTRGTIHKVILEYLEKQKKGDLKTMLGVDSKGDIFPVGT